MEPKCPYFGKCGGCSAQHIDYDIQLENKRKQLVNAINFEGVDVYSDEPYYYRNRMDFIFHANGLGLRAKGNWKKIIDIKECSIAEPKINKIFGEIQEFFKGCDVFDLLKQTGTFRYTVIRVTPEDSSVSFTLNSESSKLGEAIDKVKEFAKQTDVMNVLITRVARQTDMSIGSDYAVIKGKDMLTTTLLKNKFSYSIQGFFQNNYAMAEKMHKYVHYLLQSRETKNAYLLDLYGGVGAFGIINADLFSNVMIVESVKECIDSANKNIKLNDKKNTSAMVLDAKQLKKISLPEDLIVITDPPRSGMNPKTILQLKELKPKIIIYISCNVSQLQKDIPKFKDYEINSAALFDLFPQTPHSEAIVELKLKT